MTNTPSFGSSLDMTIGSAPNTAEGMGKEAVTQVTPKADPSILATQTAEAPAATQGFVPNPVELPAVTPSDVLIAQAQEQIRRIDYKDVLVRTDYDPDRNVNRVALLEERGADGKYHFVTYISYLKKHALDTFYDDAKKLHSEIVGYDAPRYGATSTHTGQAGRASARKDQFESLKKTAINLKQKIGMLKKSYTNLSVAEQELMDRFISEVQSKASELLAMFSIMRSTYANVSPLSTALEELRNEN